MTLVVDDAQQAIDRTTPEDISNALDQLTSFGRTQFENFSCRCILKKDVARSLVLARRHLDEMAQWNPEANRTPEVSEMSRLVSRLMKEADVADDTVTFTVSAKEMRLLEKLPLLEVEYQLRRKADARGKR